MELQSLISICTRSKPHVALLLITDLLISLQTKNSIFICPRPQELSYQVSPDCVECSDSPSKHLCIIHQFTHSFAHKARTEEKGLTLIFTIICTLSLHIWWYKCANFLIINCWSSSWKIDNSLSYNLFDRKFFRVIHYVFFDFVQGNQRLSKWYFFSFLSFPFLWRGAFSCSTSNIKIDCSLLYRFDSVGFTSSFGAFALHKVHSLICRIRSNWSQFYFGMVGFMYPFFCIA